MSILDKIKSNMLQPVLSSWPPQLWRILKIEEKTASWVSGKQEPDRS